MDIFSAINDFNKTQNAYDPSINKTVQSGDKVEKSPVKEMEELSKKEDKEKIKKELQKVIEELNKEMDPLNLALKFKFEPKVEELTVQVIDKKNDKVIREFPPKEALKLMEKMRELVGLLFDKKG